MMPAIALDWWDPIEFDMEIKNGKDRQKAERFESY